MKLIEQASSLLGRATGSLNIMIATKKVSRANVREAATLARQAADMLDAIAKSKPLADRRLI